MSKQSKLLAKILSGDSDANIRFEEMCAFLERCGFTKRVKGSHHIFTFPGIETLVDLQPLGAKCKPYQVRQVREILTKFNIPL